MPSGDTQANENARPVVRLAYTRQEAAAALGISTPTLDRLVERGLLRPSRALRRPLFSVAELQRFLEETRGSIE